MEKLTLSELPNEINALKALIKQLLEENERLQAENAELRRRLGLDSTNSHKPPSSDGYAKKTVKPGLPKESKPKGGQAGHQGQTLRRVEQPDHIKVHRPTQCVCCGRRFTQEEPHEIIQSRQVFDLPDPKLEVTEHRIAQITCCEMPQMGEYPQEVTAPVQYGPGVRAFMTKLSIDHKMPLEQISQLFEDWYNAPLNSATVEDILERAYGLAEVVEKQVVDCLGQEAVAHFDETGLRVEGKLRWLHTASTPTYTHLFIHENRGEKALKSEASVLKDFKGRAIHDCWAPYFQFDQLQHGLCGAHLLRELTGLMENGAWWAGRMRTFLLDLHEKPRPVADPEETRKRYQAMLAHGDWEEPQPQPSRRGKPKNSVGRNLLNRLTEYREEVLAFALEAGVGFTNNQAERDLRPAKVKQKVSGGFRTQNGAQVYARLQAAVSTFRKQGMNVFASLRDLFAHRSIVLPQKGR